MDGIASYLGNLGSFSEYIVVFDHGLDGRTLDHGEFFAALDKSGRQMILRRRTSRIPFDKLRPATLALVSAVLSANSHVEHVRLSSDDAVVKDLRALTWRAWVIEALTHRTHKESVDLIRIGRAEIEANPDGLALSGAAIEALALVGQIRVPRRSEWVELIRVGPESHGRVKRRRDGRVSMTATSAAREGLSLIAARHGCTL